MRKRADKTGESLSIMLLGQPRVERNGSLLEFETRKAIALLAFLVVSRENQSREALATLLYPESDQERARGALRRTLSALKDAIGDKWIDADRDSIGLIRVPGLLVDLDGFHASIIETHKHGHAPNDVCSRCIEPLTRAVDLYRGDFLSGFSLRDSANFDDWQFFQSESLRRELVQSLARLVCRCSEDGQYEAAIRHSRRWLALEPLEEPGHRQLMRLYAWTGQRTAALRQYRECVRLLDEELGVAPLDETKRLDEDIEQNRISRPPALAAPAPPSPGSLPLPTPAQPPRHAEPLAGYPLVGRAHELDVLLRLYQEMGAEGRFAVVEGEAGIGKTRLAEEFMARVRGRGALTVTARCYEGQANLAYGPFLEGLRALNLPAAQDWVGRISSQALAEVARLLPELGALRPDLPLPPLEGPGAQTRFLDSISQLLLALGQRNRCIVLLIDDLQWADSASLELLTFLVRRLSERPLYILATWRKEDVPSDHRLRALLAEAERAGTGRLISLTRLGREAVIQLVRAAEQKGTPIRPAFFERLYRESEGQPFFLVEYLALLAESGEGPAEEWTLPGGVRALLRSRLGGLSETARQLLGAAAVIGRSFDFDALSHASGRSADETVGALEELLARGIIHEIAGTAGGAPVLDFTHEKLRELVYEETSLVRRRLLHRRAAESLADRARLQHQVGVYAGQVARHFQAAGQDKQAAEYYRIAGDHARSIYANGEALDHYRAALALGDPDRASLHETIGDLETLSGEYTAALHSYESAGAFREGQPQGELESKLANVYARRGEWDQAEHHFRAALDALETSAPCETCSRIYGEWSVVVHRRGDESRALQLARRSLTLADESGDARSIAQAHNILAILARSRDDTATALAHLEKSLELADGIHDPVIRMAALNNLALVSMDRGEIEKGLGYAGMALALSSALGDRHRAAALYNNLADLLHRAGRPDEAMDHLRQAVAIYGEIGAEAGTLQPEIWKLSEW